MSARVSGLATGLLLLAVVAPARAADPVATFVAPAGVAAAGVEAEDATMDRSMLAPTALTQPAGSVVLNSYEILVLGISIGLTDRLQLSVTGLPFDLGLNRVGVGNLKWQVLRTARARLAVFGGVSYSAREPSHHQPPGETPSEHGIRHEAGPQAGLSFTWCLEASCHSLANATVTGHRGLDKSGNGYLLASGSIIARFSESTKILLEIVRGGDFTARLYRDHATVVAGGLRFFHHAAALDLGVVVDAFADNPSPFPVLSLTARF